MSALLFNLSLKSSQAFVRNHQDFPCLWVKNNQDFPCQLLLNIYFYKLITRGMFL